MLRVKEVMVPKQFVRLMSTKVSTSFAHKVSQVQIDDKPFLDISTECPLLKLNGLVLGCGFC